MKIKIDTFLADCLFQECLNYKMLAQIKDTDGYQALMAKRNKDIDIILTVHNPFSSERRTTTLSECFKVFKKESNEK